MNTLFKLLLDFARLSEAQFGEKARVIVTALTTEPMLTLVPNPIPATFPSRTVLTDKLTSYEDAVQAAMDGSKTAIKARQDERAEFEQLLKDFAPHLETTAKAADNIDILMLSGYDLRRPVVRPLANGVPSAPVIFLRRGNVSGSIIARVKPLLDNVSSYEGEYAVSPNGEANYTGRIIATAGSRITFTDLELAKVHQFRVRGIGAKGPGDWSKPVSIIVT